MRLRLTLKCLENNVDIPYNYHYQVSSAIYGLLKFSSPEFSAFLHDCGYRLEGKNYKLFTFSFKPRQFKPTVSSLHLTSPEAELYVSSPLVDDFIKNFVISTFEKSRFVLSFGGREIIFTIQFAEVLPLPKFYETMNFFLSTPMVLSTKRIFKDELKQYYLRQDDNDLIDRILLQNLQNKYKLLYKKEPTESELSLKWDNEFLLKKKNRITKKVTINVNGLYPIDIIGLQAPFKIKASPELLQVGYECGFGEKNSMGFGMVEAVNSN